MKTDLPYVCVETTRHGQKAVYFRVGKGQRVRLPSDMSSDAFTVAYLDAKELFAEEICARPPTAEQRRIDRAERVLRGAARSARTRARHKGVPFDLDATTVVQMARRQRHRCALSGIPFFAYNISESRVDPFTPSIDRIEPRAGYVRGNVRIVIYAVNAMLLDWGEPLVARIARSYLRQKRTNPQPAMPSPGNSVPRTLNEIKGL